MTNDKKETTTTTTTNYNSNKNNNNEYDDDYDDDDHLSTNLSVLVPFIPLSCAWETWGTLEGRQRSVWPRWNPSRR